jgi:GTP-binding protein
MARHSVVSFNKLRQSSPLRRSLQEEEDEDAATYYSPNVALDESRYRYDLGEGEDDVNQDDPSVNEYSFFDEAIIYVRAGSGGQGSSTFKKGVGGQNGVPDGGNGGKGGNVVMVVDDSLNTLAGLTHAWRPNSFGGSGASAKNPMEGSVRPKSFRAENGADGDRQFKNGRYGKDAVIRVPPGTVVQEEVELEDGEVHRTDLGSLTVEERTLVVAYGGEGGEGTGVAGKVAGRGLRRPRVPPEGGDKRRLKLTLKIVADVALVGVPNAGKSTFLAAVTRAKPKIANVRALNIQYVPRQHCHWFSHLFCFRCPQYPFTTVIPNLGVWIPPEFDGSGNQSEGVGSSGLVLCVSVVNVNGRKLLP